MEIFIKKGQDQEGPFTLDQIKQDLATGRISLSDLGSIGGSGEWKQLMNIQEVVDAVVPPAPTTSETPSGAQPVLPTMPKADQGGAFSESGTPTPAKSRAKGYTPAKARDQFALLLVVVCLVGSVWILKSLWFHRGHRLVVNKDQLEAQKKALENELAEARATLKQAEDELEEAVDPGEQPAWYHPYERWKWGIKHKAYVEAKETRDGIKQTVDQKTLQIEALVTKIDNWKEPSFLNTILKPFKLMWNELISPILHFFLALALFTLSVRVTFRYILMKGKIGMVRV